MQYQKPRRLTFRRALTWIAFYVIVWLALLAGFLALLEGVFGPLENLGAL